MKTIIAGMKRYLGDPGDTFGALKGEKLIFFDTETTGLHPQDFQVTELYAAYVDGGTFSVQDELHVTVRLNPRTKHEMTQDTERGKRIKKNLEMTRYDETQAQDDEHEALTKFKEFCEKHDAVLVAQNAKFDLRMIATKVGPIKNRGVYDTMLFSRVYLLPSLLALKAQGNEEAAELLNTLTNDKGKLSSSLGDVARALGVTTDWHSAKADVMSTIGVFKALGERLSNVDTGDETYKSEHAKALKKEKYFSGLQRKDRVKRQKEWRKMRDNEEMTFSSSTEALQYLANVSGQCVKIAQVTDYIDTRHVSQLRELIKGALKHGVFKEMVEALRNGRYDLQQVRESDVDRLAKKHAVDVKEFLDSMIDDELRKLDRNDILSELQEVIVGVMKKGIEV